MISKERITLTFRNEKPDRIPVSPELWDVIPIKISGRPFYEIGGTTFSKIPLWKAQLDAYRFFDCDAWIPVETGLSDRQKKMLEVKSFFVNPDLIQTEIIYKTSKGNMKEVRYSTYEYDQWTAEYPVKELLEDMPKMEEYFFNDPSKLDYSEIEKAFEETGDKGICEATLGVTFFGFLSKIRAGGAAQVILDLYDYKDYLLSLQKRYIEHLTGIVEETIKNTSVDGLFLNCWTSTTDIIGPEFSRKWDIPLIKEIGKITRKNNKIFHYHLHGKGRTLLDDIVSAGVNIVCPFECSPRGDFDLAEIKKKFGKKLAIKGNIDPFSILLNGTPEEVELKVIECIKAAGKDGGFILASGDSVVKNTPFENIIAMVNASKKYGRYK